MGFGHAVQASYYVKPNLDDSIYVILKLSAKAFMATLIASRLTRN
jgi:hypothetical protein